MKHRPDYSHLMQNIQGTCLLNEPMSKHSSYGIGGVASVFLIPLNSEDLSFALKFANKHELPVYFVGSGSNILFSDKGIDGVTISLKGSFKELKFNDSEIHAGAGVMLGHFVKEAIKRNLTGLESLVGVPGTLGGALFMNAGAYNQEISNYLLSTDVMTLDGNLKTYKKEDLQFEYRHSTFRQDEIILGAVFLLNRSDEKLIQERRNNASASRKRNQPLKYRSAGSVFKNPSKDLAAGYLIDKAGLKGQRIGDAEISNHHANFFINCGNATAEDMVKLIKLARDTVKDKFKVVLELEIKLIGFSQEEIQA